jgi:hypothetical protein
MDENGYIIFRNKINPENAISCFRDGKLDYSRMQTFIEDELLPKNLDYTKFRVSDYTNSVDASVFHRDIIPIENEVIKCFTCLTYLDEAEMQVIPGSHKMLKMRLDESLHMFTKAKTISLYAGDVMIFYSSLIHRGIFSGTKEHRRLIQVFDCYEHGNEPHIGHVLATNQNKQNDMIKLSKIPFIIDIMSFIEFLNCSQGYGRNKINYKYLSSEGLSDRLVVVPGTYQELNKYIIHGDHVVHTDEDFKFKYYYRQYIVYFIILLILIKLSLSLRK